ncbi:MAG: T9SS type A sorting domain-containing protein [Bacteroidia bacterium]|nr:T9SS type A sorting domain-containing protein [Bacteroidia bacterium]
MNNTLTKKLKAYSITAGSLTAAAAAHGQIIYTDISPDINITTPSNYNLDMDNNGQPEMDMLLFSYADSIYSLTTFYLLAYNNTATLGDLYQVFVPFPFALNSGDSISPSSPNWRDTSALGGRQYMAVVTTYYSTTNTYGYWLGTTDKYLGVRFSINNQLHYGWVRLSIDSAVSQIVIKDYAYQAAPGIGLTAGQTNAIGMEENTAGIPRIHVYDRTIFVNLPAETVPDGILEVYNATGQLVRTETITQQSMRVGAGDLASGVYFVQLVLANGEKISRKVYF